MNPNITKAARILHADEQLLESVLAIMEKITSKPGVIDDILLENSQRIEHVLGALGVSSRFAQDIAGALEATLEHDDQLLVDILGRPNLSEAASAQTLIEKAYDAAGGKSSGLFLKHEKAEEILLQSPPPAMMHGLGYSSVQELLQKEKLEEIFAALRFIESREWMNEIFVKHYEHLMPQDFEQRELLVIVLQKKWLTLAEKFLQKKYHNVSHLKELGVVFIIPIDLTSKGELIRLFSLILHYLHEVPFYTKLIERYAGDEQNFSSRLMSLIRGDVGQMTPESSQNFARWLIVQRYLAKDDEADMRLFLPHVNPEAIHWRKAQQDLVKFALRDPRLKLPILGESDYVGDFFPSHQGEERLVSFDLVDNIMGLVKQGSPVKYLYHHQEALWNRIFAAFMGQERMEELIIENLDKGYIELHV